MTNEQKTQIIALHKQGSSLPEVAGKLGLPIGTVKSFWRRNCASSQMADKLNLPIGTVKSFWRRNCAPSQVGEMKGTVVESAEMPQQKKANKCKHCGEPISTLPHHKEKQFCSDKCRLAWWHENRHLAKNVAEKTCPSCGSVFNADPARKYCSHRCYIIARYGSKCLPEGEYERNTQSSSMHESGSV